MLRSRARNTLLALVSIFLFSCAAKKAPEHITVIVPRDFNGTIRLTGCEAQARPDGIVVDARGHGSTSICSASPDLKMVVVREGKSIEVPATVSKTGDDLVVSIEAELKRRESSAR
ncbi:MAG: hypothetical protein ABSG69_00160 [Candidatus Acidiferrum sp.]|jgi:hypothetical protein